MADPLVQVIVLVEDLATARATYEAQGFAVAEGGRHPGRGTANLIVPFGRQYLELMAVVDPAEASAAPQGRSVMDALDRRGPGPARWTIEAADIVDTGARLRLAVESRQRVRPDGQVVKWQSVGVDEAWAQPWRPSFMAWDDPRLHPARLDGHHPNGAIGFSLVRVALPDRAEVVPALRELVGGPVPDQVQTETVEDGGLVGPIEVRVRTADGELRVG